MSIWNITDILSKVVSNLEVGDEWVFYVFAALILGIMIGGLVKGAARVVLGIVILSGLAVLILMLVQRDTVSAAIYAVFGVVMGLLVKLGKSVYVRR